MSKKEIPDFKNWQANNLWKFCEDAYLKIVELEQANEQLRNDFKDAMKIARKQNLGDNGA
jgi:hypothetical protein